MRKRAEVEKEDEKKRKSVALRAITSSKDKSKKKEELSDERNLSKSVFLYLDFRLGVIPHCNFFLPFGRENSTNFVDCQQWGSKFSN